MNDTVAPPGISSLRTSPNLQNRGDATCGNGPLRTEELSAWMAAVSHHGEPISVDSLQVQANAPHPTWTRQVAGYKPLHGLSQLCEAAMTL